MPNVFQSHREFKEWFSNPVTGMIEGNSEYNENIIKRLHKVSNKIHYMSQLYFFYIRFKVYYKHAVFCDTAKKVQIILKIA